MSALHKKHFWEWFKRYQNEYDFLKTKPKKEISYWLNELSAHLHAYCKFCDFILEWEQIQSNLTITVYGKVKYFKKAEDLVAKAPVIPGWTFTALADPRPIDFFLEQQIESTCIDPREFYFQYLNCDPENIDLVIYHPLCRRENEQAVNRLATAAVFNLLGERSFGQVINSLEVDNLSSAIPDDLQKLETLPASISLLKPDMVIDDKGNLVSHSAHII